MFVANSQFVSVCLPSLEAYSTSECLISLFTVVKIAGEGRSSGLLVTLVVSGGKKRKRKSVEDRDDPIENMSRPRK